MASIIFRLQRNDIIEQKTTFHYYKDESYQEQLIELLRCGYIDDSSPDIYNDDRLDIYRASSFLTWLKDEEITIIIPFNYANKYYLYINYVYYNRVINDLNYVIIINKRYAIDLDGMRIRTYSEYSPRSGGVPKYNSGNTRSIKVLTLFSYNHSK